MGIRGGELGAWLSLRRNRRSASEVERKRLLALLAPCDIEPDPFEGCSTFWESRLVPVFADEMFGFESVAAVGTVRERFGLCENPPAGFSLSKPEPASG